jgi:hypothetical protein
MTPRAGFSLDQLATIALALEELGYTGICDRCEIALGSDPSQLGRILGTAIALEGRFLAELAGVSGTRH